MSDGKKSLITAIAVVVALGILGIGIKLAVHFHDAGADPRSSCASTLTALGHELDLAADKRPDKRLPDDLASAIAAGQVNDYDAACPTSGAKYLYVGKGRTSDDRRAGLVIAYEPVGWHGDGAHFLMINGVVKWESAVEASATIADLEAGHNPPVPWAQQNSTR